MKTLIITVALALTAGVALPSEAQRPVKPKAPDKSRVEIPREHRPPPGMCRIWLDGIPASQQPASTDCATAVRNRPEKGHVIFGDDYVSPSKDAKPSSIKSFMEALKPGVRRDSSARKPDDTVTKSRRPPGKVIKPGRPIHP